MKFIVQRVKNAQVDIEGKTVGKIEQGYMVLIGITHTDTKEVADYMIKKLINLRVFEDENGKMNKSLKDVNGSLLLVSQFTLYADCSSGNRPSFTDAAKPDFPRCGGLLQINRKEPKAEFCFRLLISGKKEKMQQWTKRRF